MTPLHLRRRQPTEHVVDDSSVAGANGVDGTRGGDDLGHVTAVVEQGGEKTGKKTVLVVGGRRPTESVAVVMALASSGHRVVAVEHDPYAATLRLAELGSLIPPPGDPRFGRALKTAAEASGASAVIGSGPEEMQAIAEAEHLLSEIGVAAWSPCAEVFALCRDRSSLHTALDSSGLTVEKTGIGPTEQSGVRGRQFNVDVVVDNDHDVIAAVSSWRLAGDGDTTMVAETFFDPRLLELIRAICATILIEGPVVIEGYVSEIGRALLLGVRPGFSAMVPLARAAGIDVVGLALDGALGRPMPTRVLSHRPGVRIIRYLDQVFEG